MNASRRDDGSDEARPSERLPLTDLSFQILLSLVGEPLHGYAILQTIASRPGGGGAPASGTLYTAIRRLVGEGLLEPGSGSDDARRGRSYRLTETGREVLALESRRLAGLVAEARRRRILGSRGS